MINNLRHFRSLFFASMLTVMVMSCKKNDEVKDEDTTSTTPKIMAQVDGTSFNATTIALDETDGIYTMTGIAAGDKTMTLIFNSTAEGTYTLNFDDVSMLYSVGAITWTGGPASSGTINITDNANGKLKGTFSANLDELIMTGTTVSITSGSFEGIAY
jgi:Family of unknown function (DUF6252)